LIKETGHDRIFWSGLYFFFLVGKNNGAGKSESAPEEILINNRSLLVYNKAKKYHG